MTRKPGARARVKKQFNYLAAYIGCLFALGAAVPDLWTLTAEREVFLWPLARAAFVHAVVGFVVGWTIVRILGWVITSYFRERYLNSLDRFKRRAKQARKGTTPKP